MAPDITLWDAGEFNAAIASLGIPHPPGTPLYIVIGNTWARVFGVLPQALAVNLLSAVATALACGLLGGLMTRWTTDRVLGVASGIAAGGMLAVWQNATETEIYALSLLLGVLMIVVGDRAGRSDSRRDRVMLAYLIGLAVPVQISALILAPAAICLASVSPRDGRIRWRVAVALGGVLLVVIGVSQESVTLALIGMIAAFGSSTRGNRFEPVAFGAVMLLALSATLFMLARAQHDPLINQGNPASLDTMMDVVTRRQYSIPGLWPRRAPIWVQLLSVVQYGDWQVASGLDNSVAASWLRTPFSLLAVALLIVGARFHWAQDRRSALGTALLVAGGTLGVVTVLNLSAGPSIMDSVLPPGSRHEPRERDYFFAWGFAGAGLWIGAGAVVLVRRWLSSRARLVTPVALGLAASPIALNWRAATRRPDAAIAPALGESLLASVPPNAVLLLAGDNDSYTVWYRQAVLRERTDVVPVTISLLPAGWYRSEFERRYQLIEPSISGTSEWRGETETLTALMAAARAQGRPVVAALTVSPTLRHELAPAWSLGGMAYLAEWAGDASGLRMDFETTRRVAALIESRLPRFPEGRDPTSAYVLRLLRCPGEAVLLGSNGLSAASDSLLDSRCNFK